jgi:hypothetical protein
MQQRPLPVELVTDEIQSAIVQLGLDDGAIRLLPQDESRPLYYDLLEHYVNGQDRRWWWEDFKEPSAGILCHDQQAFKILPSLVPDESETVWFMVEEDQLDHFPIYVTSPIVATAIIEECYGFEYYLIARDRRWLICENHHGRLIGIGDIVKSPEGRANA